MQQNGRDITIVIDRQQAKREALTPPVEPAQTITAAEPATAELATDTEPSPVPTPEPEPTPPVAEPATPAPAPPPAPTVHIHVVVKGDTLWAIAERYLNDPWRYRELAKSSRIRNPDLIYPGQKVRIIIR